MFRQPELYAHLRRNAAASVVDLSTVSSGWYKEFYRLRQCLLDVPSVCFMWSVANGVRQVDVVLALHVCAHRWLYGASCLCLCWCQAPAPRVVEVVGVFNGWRRGQRLTWVKELNEFQLLVPLPCGTHEFKFVVDGAWKVSDSYAVTTDAAGNQNNVITIAESSL